MGVRHRGDTVRPSHRLLCDTASSPPRPERLRWPSVEFRGCDQRGEGGSKGSFLALQVL
jgi:hypothetical protein